MLNWGYRINNLENCCNKLMDKVGQHDIKKTRIEDNLNLLTSKIEKHAELFAQHDAKEMEKYEAIKNEIITLKKAIWMAIGAGAIVQLLVSMDLLSFGG